MTAKLKLTKDSLSREQKALTRFTRFLPTLNLRKTQLFNEMHRIREQIEKTEREVEKINTDLNEWVALFAQDIDLSKFISVRQAVVRMDNVAGIEIPIFQRVDFDQESYDLMVQPFWLDDGIRVLKSTISLKSEQKVLEQQLKIISDELRTTVQRINLFEKVKIPQTKENIRRIRIFLGDQQTAGVVRGKTTKSKLQKKRRAKKALAAAEN